jgi:transglutaminase-like putative cysteine protease
MFMQRMMTFLMCIAIWTVVQAKDDGTDASTTIEKHSLLFVVNTDGTYVETVDFTLLINEERAIKTAAQSSLEYNRERQTLEVLEAYTQKPDGRRLAVAADKILDQQSTSSANAPMFQDSRVKVIIFPDVEVGDRLVWRIQKVQLKPLYAGYFQDVRTPGFAPIKQFSLTYDMPAETPLYADNRGFSASLPVPTAGRKIYRWDYIPSENPRIEKDAVGLEEFRSRLLVGTFSDFSVLAKAYDDGAKGKSAVTPRIADLARMITKNLTNPRDQAFALDNWVRKNIRHVSVNIGHGGVIPHSADAVLANRYGDSKDQAVLMEAFLDVLNIDSTPALINASTLYTLPKVPSLDTLNRVITYIPNLDLYLDSTAAAISPGYLPRYELDKPVLLTKSGEIAHTPHSQTEKLDSISMFKIAPDGTADFTHTAHFIGVGAEITRFENRQSKQADRDNYVERILQSRGQKGAGNFNIGDIDGVNDDYEEKIAGQVENFIELPGPSGFVAPSSFMNVLSTVVYGLVAEKERTQPFICTQVDINEQARIEFPKEIDLVATPKPLILHDANFDYSAQYARDDHAVLITRHFQTHHAGKVCNPSDYKLMRPALEQMVRDIQSQIIVQTL